MQKNVILQSKADSLYGFNITIDVHSFTGGDRGDTVLFVEPEDGCQIEIQLDGKPIERPESILMIFTGDAEMRSIYDAAKAICEAMELIEPQIKNCLFPKEEG